MGWRHPFPRTGSTGRPHVTRTLAGASFAVALYAGLVPASAEESVDEALCRMIEASAAAHALPVRFLTRLIWRESSFRTGVESPAGAQGVAQFTPGTAAERGLLDPFDPEQAIPAAAALLADHRWAFGSLGLAAVAYNAGPNRARRWAAGASVLPLETEDYVHFITGHLAADWLSGKVDDRSTGGPAPPLRSAPPLPGLGPVPVGGQDSCLTLLTAIRTEAPSSAVAEGPFAPWGVQLSGNFSKARALASFERVRSRYAAVLGDVRPMVIGTRLKSRGTRRLWRVRAPAATQAEANALCRDIRRLGGACVVFRSR